MTSVRVLGPIDAVGHNGAAGAPRTAIRRTFLAVLALGNGRPISVDQLLNVVWDGRPPESGARAVRFHVSKLRKEVAVGGLIETTEGGYRLGDGITVDAIELAEGARRLADPDPRQCLARAERLAGLWRGEPFADASPCDTLDRERDRLDEIHLTVLERLHQIRLELGGAIDVLGDLDSLCAEHPLREPLWATLIEAEYRAGRQADALRTCARLRRALRDELGVNPSPRIRELEQQILDHSLQVAATSTRSASGNIGEPSDELIGRDDERRVALDAIERHRLVTVVGVGGCGKTSLAIDCAARARDDFDEVWLVELAPVSESAAVAAAIMTLLGLAGNASRLEDLTSAIRRRGRTLFVLDNCEHLIDAAVEVAAAILAAPDAHVLATSRTLLGRSDEHVVRLGPLAARDAAVALFEREARRLDPTFIVDAPRRDLIGAICDRLDDLPLALELAAARTASLDLGHIFDRLSALLETAPARGTIDPRHATITRALQWSTDLVSSDARLALGVLAVAAGTFDADAAAALTSLVSGRPAFDLLDELVTHSLVETQRTDTEMRYRLLEPVRHYALDHLLDDATAARDRHLEHYLDTLEEAFASIAGSGSAAIRRLMAHDLPNFRLVHRHALSSGRVDDDLRLYQPLMQAEAYRIFEPGHWARETLDEVGIEEHRLWRYALAKAFQTKVFQSPFWRLDEDGRKELDRLLAVGPGPGYDHVQVVAAWVEGTRAGQPDRALDRLEAVSTEDINTLYMTYVAGASPRYRHDGAAPTRAWLTAGMDELRARGADNLHAAVSALAAVYIDPDDSAQSQHDAADEAARLTNRFGLMHMRSLAVLGRIRSTLRGATSESDPLLDIIDILAGGLRTNNGAEIAQALEVAAKVLGDAGSTEAAALARAGWSGPRRFGLEVNLTGRDVEAAAARIERERLDAFDLGEIVLRELRAISDSRSSRDS